jgi:hypothetical protein
MTTAAAGERPSPQWMSTPPAVTQQLGQWLHETLHFGSLSQDLIESPLRAEVSCVQMCGADTQCSAAVIVHRSLP